ncbi:helix-turn-helix domain-containing protein [Candidatus Contubernalis alkalaceticus]|uniref:helix-turn-helix domain-containing protein n=1 Tax=Candidatus Contubernalis alkaliaceticus TaxID=338645 RepID=UPI00387EDABE|nr:helix-turn-helix domain-containing protein [Candidatus Contubernalis alkalaceticus]
MAISYNKLWKILIDKKMKKIEFMEAAGIGTTTLSKLLILQPKLHFSQKQYLCQCRLGME